MGVLARSRARQMAHWLHYMREQPDYIIDSIQCYFVLHPHDRAEMKPILDAEWRRIQKDIQCNSSPNP